MSSSAAEAAGLEAGDVLVALGGQAITDLRGYAAVLKAHQPGDEVEVRPVEHRVQVGAGGAQTTAASNILVERRKPLLAVPVDVVGPAEPGLRAGLQPSLEQRTCRRAPLELERPVATSPVVLTGEAGLHLLEVGQAMGVVPRFHPRPPRHFS